MSDKDKKKHVDNVPALADFNAPWETDAGEVEIDKPKLKKYIHGILLDAAKRADRAEEAEGKVAKAEADAQAAQKKAEENDSSGQLAEANTKLSAAEARAAKAEGQVLRLQVGEEKGLTNKQALRLVGETREELESDADAVIEEFGLGKPKSDDEEDDEEDEEIEESGIRTTPRLVSAGQRRGEPESGPQSEADFAKAIEAAGNGSFRF